MSNQVRRPKSHRPPNRTRLPLSPRSLSIQQPTLAENVRRFRVIHQNAVLQQFKDRMTNVRGLLAGD